MDKVHGLKNGFCQVSTADYNGAIDTCSPQKLIKRSLIIQHLSSEEHNILCFKCKVNPIYI